jgi:protein-S-isoprenylcysteine O-methyltransferase Ste14
MNIYIQISYWCWPVLWIVWLLGYIGLKRNVKRPQIGAYFGTTILIVAGFIFLFSQNNVGILGTQITPQNNGFGIVGALLAIVGVLFAIWARITLGNNWSGSIATVKENHQLMQSGPYAIVRHPIYTGFFFAMLGTALTMGITASYFGVVSGLVAFLIRIKIEERAMTQEFPDKYPDYKKKVRALIPFAW